MMRIAVPLQGRRRLCIPVFCCLMLVSLPASSKVCYQFSDAQLNQLATYSVSISIDSIPASLTGLPQTGGGPAYVAAFTSYQPASDIANYSPVNQVIVTSGQTTYTYSYFTIAIYNYGSPSNTLSLQINGNLNLNLMGAPPSTFNLDLSPLGNAGNLFPAGLTPTLPSVGAWTGNATGTIESFGTLAAGGFSASPFSVTSIGSSCPCPVNVVLLPEAQYMFAALIAPSPLPDYAATCGFKSFNWQQQVTTDPGGSRIRPNNPRLLPAANKLPDGSLVAPPPYFDPPPGGYDYLPAGYNPYPFVYPMQPPGYFLPGVGCTVALPLGLCPPFQYIVSPDVAMLSFVDAPAHPNLQGKPAAVNPPVGQFYAFSTALVGVGPGVDQNGNPLSVPLFAWTWNSTYNGTAGGVSQTATISPIDPGSGTGGVSITSVNGVPIGAFSPCDITYDGATNLMDVQLVINETLGTMPAASDLNHDGAVNVTDVQIAINAALGQGCSGA